MKRATFIPRTSPALHHIANGMYGVIIVEPKEGLPPVDQEFVLVQSEWYHAHTRPARYSGGDQ
jgi:nitrite reductase (NO-forming)